MASPVDDSNSVDRPVHADVASDLHLRLVVSPISVVSLNEPITVNEVVEILQALPCGKSADVPGLTCELLRLAVVRVCHQEQCPQCLCRCTGC
jgi:hypothetical protein